MLTKQQLSQLQTSILALGSRRLSIMAGVGILVMVLVGVSAHYLSRPAMQSLYAGLSAQDVTRITEALAEAGIKFDVNEQRTSVLVPFGQTARARSLLAQKGLPASARAGYELFDSMGSMGLTSFMQEVTRVRALEGEIARTIQALDGVLAARVHLVLPEQGSFRRERRDASASVLVRLGDRVQPTTGQVVRHIVAAAVPGMKPDQVRVASTDGKLLVTGESDAAGISNSLAQMERTMSAELEQKASRTLTSSLGPGNYQISITANLDIDRQQISETIFDPKSRVERSARIVKQSGSSEDAGSRAAAGVEANVPREEPNQTEADRRRQRDDRKEEQVNYELSSRTIQTVREGYRIRSLAIAIVVNKRQVLAQIGPNADERAVADRLESLKKLVAAATGSSAQRDDRIEISAIDFSSAENELKPQDSTGLMDLLLMNVGTIINALAMVCVVALVLLFGLRPILKSLSESDQRKPVDRSLTEHEPPTLVTESSGPALPSFQPEQIAEHARAPQAPSPEVAPASKRRDVAVREQLNLLIAANADDVATVLKRWMVDEPA